MVPDIANIEPLAKRVSHGPARKRLVGSIQKALLTQACLSDLRMADALVGQLVQIGNASDQSEFASKSMFRTAFMTSAIIFYARATATGSGKGERGSVQLSKLTDQQQNDHTLIIKTRNNAIAHVKMGTQIGSDNWHSHFVFAKEYEPKKWTLAAGSLSIAAHDATIAALSRQIPVAIDMMKARVRERLGDVQEAIEAAGIAASDLQQHVVDPVKWFGSVEAANSMLVGGPGFEGNSWMPLK